MTTFSRAHRRSAAAMGLTPEELADRQRRNRERRRQGQAAKLAARALAAGISVAEMRERIKPTRPLPTLPDKRLIAAAN